MYHAAFDNTKFAEAATTLGDVIDSNEYKIRLKNLLKEEASTTGKSFLISSHDLQYVTEVCDRIVVLNKGKIVRDEQTSPTTLQELELFFREQL